MLAAYDQIYLKKQLVNLQVSLCRTNPTARAGLCYHFSAERVEGLLWLGWSLIRSVCCNSICTTRLHVLAESCSRSSLWHPLVVARYRGQPNIIIQVITKSMSEFLGQREQSCSTECHELFHSKFMFSYSRHVRGQVFFLARTALHPGSLVSTMVSTDCASRQRPKTLFFSDYRFFS
jgi:hypothetical protein